MNDDEKRRIAEVIAGAARWFPNEEMFTTYLLSSNPDVWAGAWWCVMDLVEARGLVWRKCDPGRGEWRLHFPQPGRDPDKHANAWLYFRCQDPELGERWARLSCVAQAIEAGVLKTK